MPITTLARALLCTGMLVAGTFLCRPATAAEEPSTPALEVVAKFDGPIVTGVTVSRRGRIFVTFPRWKDPVTYLMAEVIDGHPVAFPSEAVFDEKLPATDRLISVQSALIDSQDRLWALDSGSINQGPVIPEGAKLIAYDLTTGAGIEKIPFPEKVVNPNSYLNDLRIDLRRGKAGFAFITDSNPKGGDAIIVVDLGTGQSWRRLDRHPSVQPQRGFFPKVMGVPLMIREPGRNPRSFAAGCDGLALSPDGTLLYYSPLSSRRLYSVSVEALTDKTLSDQAVAATVVDLGDKTTGADGLEADSRNRIYITSYEHNAILRRSPDGTIDTLVSDPRLQWPDTLTISHDRYLYITANQLNLQAQFHDGKDLRHKPWYLFRLKIDAGPALR